MLFSSFSEICNKIPTNPINIVAKDNLYIFGRNPSLSLGELIARCNVHGLSPELKDLSFEGAVINSDAILPLSHCGAILKRAEILTQLSYHISSEDLFHTLFDFLEFQYMENKGNWAMSCYNLTTDHPREFTLSFYDRVLHTIKECLKKLRMKKMHRVNEENKYRVFPRRLQRKQVLDTGFEYILWFHHDFVFLARTSEILDIDGFVLRDIQRPYQRPLLQIGLALGRAMVNLLSIEDNRHTAPVYDPFCGMGSILAEALVLGLKIVGSDIDATCVKQTRENLHWLLTKHHLLGNDVRLEDDIFQMDISQPQMEEHTCLSPFLGSIVAETNLLTPLKTYPTKMEAQMMLKEFHQNYRAYLKGITTILPNDGVGVLIFPRIHVEDDSRLTLDIRSLLGEVNCHILSVTGNGFAFPAIFVHDWKNPIIERIIVVFQKRKRRTDLPS